MATTTNRSYRKPASTDAAANLTSYWTNLADDIDADVQNLYSGLGIVVVPVTTATAGTVTVSTTETFDAVLGNLVFTAKANIRYKVTLAGRGLAGSVANDRYSLKLRYTTDGSTPTASSTLLGHDSTVVPIVTTGNGVDMKPHIVTFKPGAGTITVRASWQRVNGTGVGTPTGTCEFFVEAIGFV